jgi:hypothetical protein
MMECVQEDPSNPQPCTQADTAKFPGGQLPAVVLPGGAGGESSGEDGGIDTACNPDFDDCSDAAKR